MPSRGPSPAGSADGGSVALSTGQTVDLPLSTEATMLGAVYSAPREMVEELLPPGLRPVRVTSDGTAAVTFIGVEYYDIGVEGIEPYDEFSVVVPAVRRPTFVVPYLSALYRAARGYVWYLPVTTEPAKALGVDVWGYPKVVADITHEDDGSRRTTTVTVDGERFVTLEVERPPSVPVTDAGHNYTVRDGEARRVPVEVDGRLGGWPFSDRVSVELGPHERADPLRRIDLESRSVGRIAVTGRLRFYPDEPFEVPSDGGTGGPGTG